MEQSIEYGMDLPWLMLTIILCGVFLIVGYRQGYKQRKDEEREAIEKSRAAGGRTLTDTDSHGHIREERLRIRTERELLREERQRENRKRWEGEERELRAIVGHGAAVQSHSVTELQGKAEG